MGPVDTGRVRVEVVYCPAPGQCDRVSMSLAAGASVGDAVRASGLPERHALDPSSMVIGVWGRKQPLDAALRDRDRVELYRPLQVDPKEARRLRYKRTRQQAAPG
jgi:putative ubiquitin-RnfH superfamily antitoxin RatB of RatAB toxin-antitoxin module